MEAYNSQVSFFIDFASSNDWHVSRIFFFLFDLLFSDPFQCTLAHLFIYSIISFCCVIFLSEFNYDMNLVMASYEF